MAGREPEELKPIGDQPSPSEDVLDEDVPSWQQRSVDRSMQSARLRARKRSDRFVDGALGLIGERADADFTIQEVVDRSDMSVRTFYTFFDGKDSLLLAVYATILRKTAVPMLRERCDRQPDPVLRVKELAEAMLEITAIPAPLSRALSVFHLRLAESRPEDLGHALEPLRSLVTELLVAVAEADRLRMDLELPTLASLLMELLQSSAHSAVLAGGRQTSAEDLWAFCSAAILRPGETVTGPSRA